MRFADIKSLKSNFYFKVRTQGFNQNEILRCKDLKIKVVFYENKKTRFQSK